MGELVDVKVKKEVVFQQKPLPSPNNNQPIGYNLAPPDQKFLNNIISSTKQKVSQAVNSAKAKYMWIQQTKNYVLVTNLMLMHQKKLGRSCKKCYGMTTEMLV